MLYIDWFESPIGFVEISATDNGVSSVFFVQKVRERNGNFMTSSAKKQLLEYFAGTRVNFDLVLEPTGTDFQKSVWKQLQTIKYGQTISYKDVAQKIVNPKAVRAVGAANGRNPISIVIPCHRVIAASGQLSGYAGGVERKAWLLDHEKKKDR